MIKQISPLKLLLVLNKCRENIDAEELILKAMDSKDDDEKANQDEFSSMKDFGNYAYSYGKLVGKMELLNYLLQVMDGRQREDIFVTD